jgi:hypothetical protein
VGDCQNLLLVLFLCNFCVRKILTDMNELLRVGVSLLMV